MLGYTGTWEGKPVSVQSSGMGCPSAAIVIEELVQLGVKKIIRVGTCGGLQPHHALGDMIVALTRGARRTRTVHTYVQRAALPDRRLGARPRGRARREGDRPADARRADRLERRLLQPRRRASTSAGRSAAILAVEMEAAVLFTLGALRKVQAGCLLTVSDIVVEGEFKRISDDELRAAVDRMTRIALATVDRRRPLATTVFLVNPASATARPASAGPSSRTAPRELGLDGETLLSERPGPARRARRAGGADGAELVVAVGGDGTRQRGRERAMRAASTAPSSRRSRAARAGTSAARTGSRRRFDDAVAVALEGRDAHDRRRPRRVPRVERRRTRSAGSRTSPAPA